MDLERRILEIDGEKLVCEFLLQEKNAVILHGAGTSERKRYYPLANELLKHGVGVVLFDFSGHGESTGHLSDLSLARRKEQAQRVIDQVLPWPSKFYLLGFSMGAQTVCELLAPYNDRLEAILLGCPAIYTRAVSSLLFGDKNFTAKLQEENSWKQSTAPGALKGFEGLSVIAIGNQDEVIPQGVLELLKSAAQNLIYKEYPGVTHQLAKWLAENPKELSRLIDDLTRNK